MAMDSDSVLHFEAVVLDDDTRPWTAAGVASVIEALKVAALTPIDGADPAAWASAAGDEQPISFSGAAGDAQLVLEESGGWWWDTPASTLMKSRHTNRPEAVAQTHAAVRAIIECATPYFGCTWFSSQTSPLWMRTNAPFRAQDGKALQFFSSQYLRVHHGGKPFRDPPVEYELIAGGQLLVANRPAFGEDTDVDDLTSYLQKAQGGR